MIQGHLDTIDSIYYTYFRNQENTGHNLLNYFYYLLDVGEIYKRSFILMFYNNNI